MIDFVNNENRSCATPTNSDPFPWLDPEDPRRHLTDEQILDHTIDLTNTTPYFTREKEVNGDDQTLQEGLQPS